METTISVADVASVKRSRHNDEPRRAAELAPPVSTGVPAAAAQPLVIETPWPPAEFIIGNPPFLGGKMMIGDLGEEYVERLRTEYDDRLPRFSDLCCYFFEKARAHIERGNAKRAGLLATNSIRGGANRVVLNRIKQTGDIYMAWSDEPWILNGAAVRISIVGFDDGSEKARSLNGDAVAVINSDLTSSTNLTTASPLIENQGLGFIGIQTLGAFDVDQNLASKWMQSPGLGLGTTNRDVLRPYMNALDMVRRSRDRWIVDFGSSMVEEEAALFEQPYEHIREHVMPLRMARKEEAARRTWWIHWRTRPELIEASRGKHRLIATPIVSKHRLFLWVDPNVLVSHAGAIFAREDDYFFGVLHSRAHEIWSLRMGTWLGKGNDPRYTPTTCFETFPLPWPPGQEPVDDPRVVAIGEAAAELDRLRRAWLDPEGATETELKQRTLTNLYNARPTWLQNAHATLDRAVWAAYGWDDPEPSAVDEDTILARLLTLNGERAQA